jgi:hypothetical protein
MSAAIHQKIFASLLLLLYAFGVLRPVIPLVNDAVAHCFWKMDHIATVHLENGKYHVHVELAKAGENENAPERIIASYEMLAIHISETASSFKIFLPASKVAATYCKTIAAPVYPSFSTPPPEL